MLRILKEAVEAVLLDEQNKVLGRGRYKSEGSKGWRWGYRQMKSILTPLGQPGWAHHPHIREEMHEVCWLRKNGRRVRALGEWIYEAVEKFWCFMGLSVRGGSRGSPR